MKRAMVYLESGFTNETSARAALQKALVLANALKTMPLEVNLWQAQNIWNDLLRRSDSGYWSKDWKEDFRKLGYALHIAVDQLVVEEGVPTF
jgi:hypothetical protein